MLKGISRILGTLRSLANNQKYSATDLWLTVINCLFVFFFIFNHRPTNLVLILLALSFLFRIKHLGSMSNQGLKFLVLSGLMFLLIFGIAVYGSSFPEALKISERYGLLVAMPLFLSSFNTWKGRDVVLGAFVVSVSIACLYCLSLGIYHFIFTPPSRENMNEDLVNGIVSRWNFLSYQRLLRPLDLSPSYTSLFVSFVFFILFTRRNSFPKYKILLYGFLLLLGVIIFLIGSRIGVIGFLMAFLVLLIKAFYKKSIPRKKLVIYILGMVFILSTILSFNEYIQKRLVQDFQSFEVVDSVESWNSITIRLAIWECNLSVIRDHPIWGIGFNETLRNECYQQYSFHGAYVTNPDAHNQFIEFYYVGGIFLFIILIFFIYFPLKLSLKWNNDLFLVLMILIGTHFLTECSLGRIKTVYFITYFISFFIYSSKEGINKK